MHPKKTGVMSIGDLSKLVPTWLDGILPQVVFAIRLPAQVMSSVFRDHVSPKICVFQYCQSQPLEATGGEPVGTLQILRVNKYELQHHRRTWNTPWVYHGLSTGVCLTHGLASTSIEIIFSSTVDGCKILHHPKDGWNPIKNGMFTTYQLVIPISSIHRRFAFLLSEDDWKASHNA